MKNSFKDVTSQTKAGFCIFSSAHLLNIFPIKSSFSLGGGGGGGRDGWMNVPQHFPANSQSSVYQLGEFVLIKTKLYGHIGVELNSTAGRTVW